MAEIKDSKLIRDALGSPVPQYWDETSQMYIARTVDGSFADVDFSKVRLLRDKLGSPIPQLWDTETARFVPGKGGANGDVTIESVPGLKEKLDTTTAQLAEKAQDSEVRKKAVKLELSDMSETTLGAMNGTATFNLLSIPQEKSVTPTKNANVIMGKNLFDKDTAVIGYYANAGGGLLPNADYFASDWIPVLPNTQYTKNDGDQAAFYDVNKEYIAPCPTATFTTPVNCYYLRTSSPLVYIDTYQVELGSTKTDYAPFSYQLKGLANSDEALKEEVDGFKTFMEASKNGYFEKVMAHLRNPFVKTQVKIIGDSITAGVGGTGFSATGEDIGTTGQKANVHTATSWANMLRDNLLTNFNKEYYVELDNPNIANEISEGTFSIDDGAFLKSKFFSPNTKPSQKIVFEFFGDHFSIIYAKTAGSGILEVWVDGAKLADLDTYGILSYSNEASYNGLALAHHQVEIRQSGRQNTSSSSTAIYLEAIKIPKTVIVKSWGISGITSQYIYNAKETLITDVDDIVVLQIGTNDRISYNTPATTRTFLREITNYAHSKGAETILMSSNAVAATNDNSVEYNFKMHSVNDAIHNVANEYGMPYISNYAATLNYVRLTGISINDLLADGLHPNDLLYRIMYENIANELGLSLLVDGVTL